MNDRIKELYNQSGGLVRMYDGKLTYFPAYQKNVGNGNFEFSSFDPKKFAELIVRECAGLCDQAAEENARTFYTVTETQEVGPALASKGSQVQAEKLSRQIKQHFGVEE
jgi:hypothetical protein